MTVTVAATALAVAAPVPVKTRSQSVSPAALFPGVVSGAESVVVAPDVGSMRVIVAVPLIFPATLIVAVPELAQFDRYTMPRSPSAVTAAVT